MNEPNITRISVLYLVFINIPCWVVVHLFVSVVRIYQ